VTPSFTVEGFGIAYWIHFQGAIHCKDGSNDYVLPDYTASHFKRQQFLYTGYCLKTTRNFLKILLLLCLKFSRQIPVRHGKGLVLISGLNRSLNHDIWRQFPSTNEVNIMLPGNGEQRNQIIFTCLVQQILYSENVILNNCSPPRQMWHHSGLSRLK
jgi:hypothetical protein